MLGLPSTTEVGRRISKEAFYRNLKVGAALKRSFIDDVDGFVVQNSLKPGTINVAAGERVSEVLVLEVALSARKVPEDVLAAVAAANPHKLLFVCTYGDEACLALQVKDLIVGPWQSLDTIDIPLKADTMDGLWDSLASQVVYGDAGSRELTVEERYERDAKLAAMRRELESLRARSRKEKQFARKNELFKQAKMMELEIDALEEDK